MRTWYHLAESHDTVTKARMVKLCQLCQDQIKGLAENYIAHRNAAWTTLNTVHGNVCPGTKLQTICWCAFCVS